MSADPLEGASAPTLLAQVAAATRMTDGELAALLGVSRPCVNLWRNGKTAERYTKPQRQALWDALTRQRVLLAAAISRITS